MLNKANGFTVVELLIASSIFLVVLGIITEGLINGGEVTQKIVLENDLLEDANSMSNMIADKITQAIYVYPPGIELELSTSDELTTYKPGTSSSVWTVGSDPIIAFLERPKDTSALCDSTVTDGCVFFYAYYPVERSVVTQTTGPYPYLQDSNNSTAWTLFEYSKRLDSTYTNIISGTHNIPTGDEIADEIGIFIADYIIEGGFNISFDLCHDEEGYINDNNDDNVPDCDGLSAAPLIYASVVNGSFSFEQSRAHKVSVKGMKLELAIAPRNLLSPTVSF